MDNREIKIIPTKNGVHLITSPFNLNEFNKKFPKISIHKDSPTLLYYYKEDIIIEQLITTDNGFVEVFESPDTIFSIIIGE